MAFDFDDALANADQGGAPTGGSTSTGGSLMVYLGQHPGPDRGPALHADSLGGLGAPDDQGPAMHHDPETAPWAEQRTKPTGDKLTDIDTAMTMIYQDGVQKRFIDLLLRNGIIERGNYSWDDIEGWWQTAVEGAAKAYQFGEKKLTPYQWLELWHGSGAAGAGGAGETSTSVNKSFTEIDDLDARAAAEEVWSRLMGKAPKGKEAEAVHEMLNAYAQAHPSITRATTKTDADGNSRTTTKTSGGMDQGTAQTLIEDEVKSKPGYAEYQAATTYFNALQQAVGATADV